MDIKTILHPTDGSPQAAKALDLACDLAAERKARLIILHAQRRHGWDVVPEELKRLEQVEHIRVTEADLRRSNAQAVVNAAETAARGRGLTGVETVIVEGDPTRVIVDTAQAKRADLIVIGSRGLGDLQGLLLGSISHKVAHAAPCSCLIVR